MAYRSVWPSIGLPVVLAVGCGVPLMPLVMGTYKTEALQRFQRHLPAVLVAIAAILAYLPALQNGFVLDDKPLVLGNPYIKSWKFLPEMLTEDLWNVWERGNYWRPAFYLSLALDYSLWGLTALGFHLTNVLIHVFNTALLFLFLRKFTDVKSAVLGSLLFGLHPIQAHTVSVISTRGDLLAVFFSLLALHAFFGKNVPLLALSLALALLSKETAMVLPAVFLAACFIVRRKADWRLISLSFIIPAIYGAVRLSLGFSFSLPPSVFSYPADMPSRMLLVFKVVALYFASLLNLFHLPRPVWTTTFPASFSDPSVIGGLAIVVLLAVAVGFSIKKYPIAALGLMWFVICFLPISNLKELNQLMAEHWLYLPMVGLSVAFAAGLGDLQSSEVRVVKVGIATAVSVYLVFAALVTREKIKVYQDDRSFMMAAVRANPQVARLYSILGSTFLAGGDAETAKELYARALELDPDDFLANYRTGYFYYNSGEHEKAKLHLEKVLRPDPPSLFQILVVAHAWEMLGDKEKSRFYYLRALAVNPHSEHIKKKVAALQASP